MMQLADNFAVDWLKTVVQSYVYTMKQLVVNTFTELYPETWSSASSTPAMTSHDMLVLATAFCGIFSPLVSLGAIYVVVKVVCWICLGQPSSTGHSECLLSVVIVC